MKHFSWRALSWATVAIAVITIWSCADNNAVSPEDDASAANAGGVTDRGVKPLTQAGNFASSSDDQVCYDIFALGLVKNRKGEIIAGSDQLTGDLYGFKIDPPAGYDDGFLRTTISANGRELSWETLVEGTQVLAFIMKGGPNYNLYDYYSAVGNPAFNWAGTELDGSLISPQQGRNIPQISHYNVCYIRPPGEAEGCTPGYWRNHVDRWVGAAPGDNFDTTFGVTQFGAATLCQVISAPNTYGAYAFHAVAALLNANGGVPNSDGEIVDKYAYTSEQVIAGYANGTITLADFTAANEAGCPLSGTKALKCN